MQKNKSHPLDNTNIKWEGSVDYKTDIGTTEYFYTEEESFVKVLQEIYIKYKDQHVVGININRINYD